MEQTKYIKEEWPDYQVYMGHPDFDNVSYYIVDDNSYMIPEWFIEKFNTEEFGL